MTPGLDMWPVFAAAIAFGWIVGLAYVHPAWSVALALGLTVWEAVFGPSGGSDVGGIIVYPRDGIFVAMALAAGIRLATGAVGRPETKSPTWAWWVLIGLACISLTRGVQEHGANLAGNDFRPVFYLLAGFAALRFHPCRWSCVRDIVDLWIGAAIVLVAVGFLRTMGVTIGVPVEAQPFIDGRALYAGPTLLIGQAVLLSFFGKQFGSRWARFPALPYVFMVAVVVFRHRTVWIAMLIVLGLMWTVLKPDKAPLERRFGRHLTWAGICLGVFITLVAAGKIESLGSELAESAESTTAQESTFIWRLDGWKYLLRSQSASPADLVFGIPYGAGYHREVFEADVEYSPHSWYVQMISRVGVLGCSIMVLAVVGLFKRGRAAGLLPRNLGALLVLSTAIYGLTYFPADYQGMLLGLVAISGLRRGSGPASAHAGICNRRAIAVGDRRVAVPSG